MKIYVFLCVFRLQSLRTSHIFFIFIFHDWNATRFFCVDHFYGLFYYFLFYFIMMCLMEIRHNISHERIHWGNQCYIAMFQNHCSFWIYWIASIMELHGWIYHQTSNNVYRQTFFHQFIAYSIMFCLLVSKNLLLNNFMEKSNKRWLTLEVALLVSRLLLSNELRKRKQI